MVMFSGDEFIVFYLKKGNLFFYPSWSFIQLIKTPTIRVTSFSLNCFPFFKEKKVSTALRSLQPQACCAMNTGCPLVGVW